MKYVEDVLWILDKPGTTIHNQDEHFKENIAFVHSLGKKCDCVGWSRSEIIHNRRERPACRSEIIHNQRERHIGRSLHLCSSVQHIFNENAISGGRIVDQDVSHSADKLSVLNNG